MLDLRRLPSPGLHCDPAPGHPGTAANAGHACFPAWRDVRDGAFWPAIAPPLHQGRCDARKWTRPVESRRAAAAWLDARCPRRGVSRGHSGSSRGTEIRTRPRSQTLFSSPCRAAWSATGPEMRGVASPEGADQVESSVPGTGHQGAPGWRRLFAAEDQGKRRKVRLGQRDGRVRAARGGGRPARDGSFRQVIPRIAGAQSVQVSDG